MNIYFVRQGIYDRKHKINAYELLFDNNVNRGNDREEAELQLICNCVSVGLSQFVNNKKAFINFSEIAILEDIPSLLGSDLVVVQISENFILNNETKEALSELKKNNFTIVLNDVTDINKIVEFEEFINIFRISFAKTTKSQRSTLIRQIEHVNTKAIFMASDISKEEEYNEAIYENYYYLQGPYLSSPDKIKDKAMAVKNINRFNIIVELLKEEFDIAKIEYLIKSDLGISYKLMRFLNSAVFEFRQKITSIRQAIMLLGKENLKKWLTLVAIIDMQIDQNEELSTGVVVRGRLCELIAEKIIPEKASQSFLVGIFSNLSMFLDKSDDEIIKDLPIDNEIKDAINGEENELGDILKLVKYYEKMDYNGIEYYTEKINFDKSELLQLYMNAIEWSNKLLANSK